MAEVIVGKVDPAQIQQSQSTSPSQSTSSGVGANIGGIGLGMLGHLTNIFGPEIGFPVSAALSGAGGALGEGTEEVLSGKGLNAGNIAKAAGTQAAFGAIPGGDELKALGMASKVLRPLAAKGVTGLLARTGARFGTGALATGGVAGVNDLGSGKSASEIGSDITNQGLMGGTLNTAFPLAGKALSKLNDVTLKPIFGSLPARIQSHLDIRTNEIRDKELSKLQQIFGRKVIDTTPGAPIINPEYQTLMDKFGLKDEPSLVQIGNKLKTAAQTVEEELQTGLTNQDYRFDKGTVNQIFKESASPVPAGMGILAQSKKAVMDTLNKILKKAGGDESALNLPTLMEIKRYIGTEANWNQKGKDPFKEVYSKLDDLINSTLQGDDKLIYDKAMTDHQKLIEMTSNYRGLMEKSGKLPQEVQDLAGIVAKLKDKPLSDPILQAIGVILGTAVGGGTGAVVGGMTGNPALGTGMATAGSLGGYQLGRGLLQDPAIAQMLKNILQKPGGIVSRIPEKVQQGVPEILRQLNIRIPQMNSN